MVAASKQKWWVVFLQPAENGIEEDQLDGPSSVIFGDQDGSSVFSFGYLDGP